MAKKKKKKTSKKVAKKKKASGKSGRGKKSCPKCGKKLGVRSAECSCGHKFSTATKKKKKTKKTAKSSTAVDQIQSASQLIKLAGGPVEAKAIIDALNQAPF